MAKPIEQFVINPDDIQIPDEGLGEFVNGYTEERIPFSKDMILWNLLPGVGQLFFIGYLVKYWMIKKNAERILLYQSGFIHQNLDGKRLVRKENVVNFDDLNGVLVERSRQYQVIYGIRKYVRTDVCLWVSFKNNTKKRILSGSYRNEHEVDGYYNFEGFACNAINNAWMQFAFKRFNDEFAAKGYGSFTTPSGEEVLVGSDFIKIGDTVVSSGFKYSFDNGTLYLYPNAAEGGHFKTKSKPVSIYVAEMFNKEVFLTAIAHLHGIK
ncbi:MAG: hypothetical protein NC336_07895 [Clostridium sp.]|nr:hypothetical protein [Clostridium sp.]